MKKFISIMLVVVLCFSVMATGASAAKITDKTLKFKADGEFKIMQVADLQDTAFAAPATYDYLRAIVAEEDIDLVVLTGDNISSGTGKEEPKALAELYVKKAIDNTMSVFEELAIPVAVVFGNHDGEGNVSKEEQMAMYTSYGCCVAVDEGNSIYGCGTYNLPILSSDGKDVVYNLWMFDSNMYDEVYGGYDYVHQDQIDWYVETSNALKEANEGEAVPSMVFQHIIVNEIYDAMEQFDQNVPGGIERGGKYYALPLGTGVLGEAPCPGTQDSQQFEAMVAQGDVKAMFFGHDHVNVFAVPYKGIDIVNSPTSGFGSYGNKETRGVRIITINENDTSTYETKVINYYEKFAVDNVSKCRYLVSEGSVWDCIRYFFVTAEILKAAYEVFCAIA